MYVSVIAYVVRDGMFLQWMVSQKIKAPVLKGSALLVCYYVGSLRCCCSDRRATERDSDVALADALRLQHCRSPHRVRDG